MKKNLRLWLIKKLNAVAVEDHSRYTETWSITKKRLEVENKRFREDLLETVSALADSNTLLKQIADTLPNIKDSDKNEGTAYPWWAIVIPRQIMRKDPHAIACCIKGVYFSRESAEAHLNSRRYEYGENAIVHCFGGYWSAEYNQLLKDVSMFRDDHTS